MTRDEIYAMLNLIAVNRLQTTTCQCNDEFSQRGQIILEMRKNGKFEKLLKDHEFGNKPADSDSPVGRDSVD